MNTKRKAIIIVASLAIAVMFIYPPFITRYSGGRGSSSKSTYGFIWNTPDSGGSTSIDLSRLFVQIVPVILISGVLILTETALTTFRHSLAKVIPLNRILFILDFLLPIGLWLFFCISIREPLCQNLLKGPVYKYGSSGVQEPVYKATFRDVIDKPASLSYEEFVTTIFCEEIAQKANIIVLVEFLIGMLILIVVWVINFSNKLSATKNLLIALLTVVILVSVCLYINIFRYETF